MKYNMSGKVYPTLTLKRKFKPLPVRVHRMSDDVRSTAHPALWKPNVHANF